MREASITAKSEKNVNILEKKAKKGNFGKCAKNESESSLKFIANFKKKTNDEKTYMSYTL
ncbi:MAG: hypothetical protein KA965_08520 [Butyrivibrio sp.]|nr:hypothetical protein [Butyrivibrio sp.]